VKSQARRWLHKSQGEPGWVTLLSGDGINLNKLTTPSCEQRAQDVCTQTIERRLWRFQSAKLRRNDGATSVLGDQLNTNILREWDNGYPYLQASVLAASIRAKARQILSD
jgi:hypothetical protein